MNDLNLNSLQDIPDTTTGLGTDDVARSLEANVRADVHDLSEEMKHVGGDALAEARKATTGQITAGKEHVAKTLGGVADALRRTGDDLKSREDSGVTEYVSRAAERVEAASGYLRDHSVADVLGDVTDFARREPALFLGGAFVLGLFGGRFLKSSGTPARSRQNSAPDQAANTADRAGSSASGEHARHINTPKARANMSLRESNLSYAAPTLPETPENKQAVKAGT